MDSATRLALWRIIFWLERKRAWDWRFAATGFRGSSFCLTAELLFILDQAAIDIGRAEVDEIIMLVLEEVVGTRNAGALNLFAFLNAHFGTPVRRPTA